METLGRVSWVSRECALEMIAVEQLPLPFLVVDRQGYIKRANRNALGLLGEKADAIDGMPFSAFLHPDSVGVFLTHLWTAFQRPGESFSFTGVVVASNKTPFTASIYSLVPNDPVEQTLPFVCQLQIVAESHSSDRFPDGYHLFQRFPAGLFQLDSDGRVLACNTAACELLDYHEDQLVGCQVSRLFVEDPSGEPSDSDAGEQSLRALAIRRDGVRVSVELRSLTLPRAPARPTGKVLVVRDLSQQEDLERRSLRLAELERQAIGREMHDALGQNMVALALMADELVTKAQRESGATSSLARRIAQLCRETTKISRALVKGLAPVGLSNGDLSAALEELVRSCRQTFPIACEAICQPIPALDQEVAEHLFRIAQEAVTNAIKHSNCRSIVVNLHLHHQDLLLVVHDDGTGMSPSSGQQFGTGLHSMHHRSQLLGAILSLESKSRPGSASGCRVTVRLPMSRTASPRSHRWVSPRVTSMKDTIPAPEPTESRSPVARPFNRSPTR